MGAGGGLIIGRIFVSEIGGGGGWAYFREGVLFCGGWGRAYYRNFTGSSGRLSKRAGHCHAIVASL